MIKYGGCMPEKMRVILCGYDPMLVRGYVKTGEEALWFYLPEELANDYNTKEGDVVKGTLEKVYEGKNGTLVAEPNEKFEWPISKFNRMAVVVPGDVITKYELTAWHFLELTVEAINDQEVYPRETKQRKMWPEDRLKLHFTLDYVPPA